MTEATTVPTNNNSNNSRHRDSRYGRNELIVSLLHTALVIVNQLLFVSPNMLLLLLRLPALVIVNQLLFVSPNMLRTQQRLKIWEKRSRGLTRP
jgi:hypothetical protein